MRCSISKDESFTLVEVLITATIFSIVALGLATSFFSGVKLWGRAQARGFYYNNVILNMEIISRELRQSFYLPQLGYNGKPQELSFPVVKDNIIFRVTYKFDPEQKIFLRGQVALKDILSNKEKESYAEEKIMSLDDFSLSYFYPENTHYVWKNEWKNPGVFIAVRLKARVKDEEFDKTIFIPAS